MPDTDSQGNESEEINITEQVLLLSINNTYGDDMDDDAIFRVTHQSWKMGEERHENATYAFAVYKGIVKAVFRIKSWHPDERSPGRFIFEGEIALPEILNKYRGKSVQHYRKHGEANPVLYINC
jgi:hypothetical protein